MTFSLILPLIVPWSNTTCVRFSSPALVSLSSFSRLEKANPVWIFEDVASSFPFP
jgi:hypothetical protein